MGRGMGRRRWAALALIAACLCAVEAGHFQYGTVGYEIVEGTTRTVKFTVRTQWQRRYSMYSVFAGSGPDMRPVEGDVVDLTGSKPVELDPGDGNAAYSLKLHVVKSSTRDDFVYGESIVIHTYGNTRDSFDAMFSVYVCIGTCTLTRLCAGGCCRASQAGASWNIRTQVTFSGKASLVVWGLPIQTVYSNTARRLNLPASTPLGDRATYWRLAQGSEWGDAARINSTAVFFNGSDYLSGALTVDARQLSPGLYPVVVVISNQASTVSYDFTLQVVSPPLNNSSPPIFEGGPWGIGLEGRLQGFAGYEVFVTLRARNTTAGADVTEIREFALPDGAVMSNARIRGVGADYGFYRDFRWTPSPQQVGGVFSACVEALDTRNLSSGQRCFDIAVMQSAEAPVFESPSPSELVGSMLPLRLSMLSSRNVSLVASSGNAYAGLLIRVAEGTPLRFGQYLSATSVIAGRYKATDTASKAVVTATFAWQPGVEHGGYDDIICFEVVEIRQDGSAVEPPALANGTSPTVSASRVCARITVERCVYNVVPGDTYQTITRSFGVDWLTLWGLNIDQKSLVPTPGSNIVVGRLYSVAYGDTLLSISREFGTSVASLRRFNYNLLSMPATRTLEPSSLVCVFPNTCTD